MIVKIVNARIIYKDMYMWYHTKIGECYDVFDHSRTCYKLLPPSNLIIFKSDCIDINELRLNKLKNILK